MARIKGDKFGEEVCRILGIASNDVRQLNLILKAGDVAKVAVLRYITNEEGEVIKQVLERYEIVEKQS